LLSEFPFSPFVEYPSPNIAYPANLKEEIRIALSLCSSNTAISDEPPPISIDKLKPET
jgi:hypothetical protein